LAENPDLGKRRDELYKGLRVYPSGKHVVFYITMDKGIDVVRILHGSMDTHRFQDSGAYTSSHG
jgi:toxin ParE1/3/4